MKKRIAIKPESSLEALLCLPPVISALKAQNPGAEIGVLGEACYQEAAALIPNIDFFLKEEAGACSVYDFSNYSGESWGLESADWKAYIQGCASLGNGNPYHLIDLFRKAAALETVDANFELIAQDPMTAGVPDSLHEGQSLRIAICTSTVPIDSLQAALEGISRVSCPVTIYLVGTVSDRRKSALLGSAWGGKLQVLDLCGRQSILATAETLRLCDITITGPGSSAIISSGYGTFTICIDEGRNPLHYPYGHGHLVIQKTESSTFGSALTGICSEIIQFALEGNGGNIPSIEQWQSFADERIDNYLSKVRLLITQRIEVVMKDRTSFTELYQRPLIFMGSDKDDIFQSFYRLLWEHSLSARSVSTNDLQILHQDAAAEVAANIKALEKTYELANFGQTYSAYTKQSLLAGDLKRAKSESTQLQEVEDLIYSIGKNFSAIVPILSFHEKRQQLISATDPVHVAEEMAGLYANLKERVLVLLDLAASLFHTTLQNEAALAPPVKGEGRIDG